MNNKVYCCFQFYTENEILKLKLEELWNVVDYFVITEGQFSHTGIPKPLNFLINKNLFEKYSEKIIYQPLLNNRWETIDPKFTIVKQRHDLVVEEIRRVAPWDTCIPHYSRDIFEKESAIVPLLDRCNENDLVILGDCDEIPRANILKNIISNFDTEKIYHLHHDNYWYYLNLLKTDEKWYGNILLSYGNYLKNSFCDMRQHKQGTFIPNAGWHFSYMPVDRIKNKTKITVHQDLVWGLTDETIQNRVRNAVAINQDVYGRPAKFQHVEITSETHPLYLVEHQSEFDEFIMK